MISKTIGFRGTQHFQTHPDATKVFHQMFGHENGLFSTTAPRHTPPRSRAHPGVAPIQWRRPARPGDAPKGGKPVSWPWWKWVKAWRKMGAEWFSRGKIWMNMDEHGWTYGVRLETREINIYDNNSKDIKPNNDFKTQRDCHHLSSNKISLEDQKCKLTI